MIGKTITHYKILQKLGAGGMGEVYRAEDLNLNCQVAIKVLPNVFAADRERLARFQCEAKVLASLNHPNTAAIYGVEEADGKRFLVLELVEGETLPNGSARAHCQLKKRSRSAARSPRVLRTRMRKVSSTAT
jgi:serine/threonine protein kinase